MVLNIPRILEYSWSTFDFFETAYCAIIHEDEIQIEPIDVFAFFLLDEIGMGTFSDYHDDDSLVEKATYETSSVYGFGHYAYYSNVLKTLQGKEESICDGYQGLKSLELITAAYKSAKEKRIINLPLMNS